MMENQSIDPGDDLAIDRGGRRPERVPLGGGQELAVDLHAGSGLQGRWDRHVRDQRQNGHASEIVRIARQPAEELRHCLDEQHSRDEGGPSEVRF